MSIEKDYYVYKHINSTTNEVFYIGMGKGKRANQIYGRSKFWLNIYNKYGRRVEIIEKNLSKNDAMELEKKMIKIYGRIDLGTGSLVNMSDGGEAVWNDGLESEKQPRYGCKNSNYQRELARQKMLINNPMKNKEYLEKMINTKKGVKWDENRFKEIEVFKDGKFLGIYKGINNVCEIFSLNRSSVVGVLSGNRNSVYGYIIKYKK